MMQGENEQHVVQCPTNRHGDNKKSQDDGDLIVSFLNCYRQKFESSLIHTSSSLDTQAGSHHRYFLILLDVLCELLLKIWPMLLECSHLSILKYFSALQSPFRRRRVVRFVGACGGKWVRQPWPSFQERLSYLVFQLMEIPATWYRRPWGLTRLVKTTSDIPGW